MRLLASALFVAAILASVMTAQFTVSSVDRLGPATTSKAPLNFLVSFSDIAQGVDVTDFAPIALYPATTITGFGNNALDFRFGGSRPTRCFCTSLVGTITDVTVEFWIATDDAGGTVLDYAVQSGTDDEITIRDNGGNQWIFRIGNTTIVTANAVLNDGQWHHVAATWVKSTGLANMYVDGTNVGSGTGMAGHVIPSGGTFVVGANASITGLPTSPTFGGNIYGRYDDVRLWGVARTPTQMNNARNRAQRPTTTGLVLNWQCDLAEDCGVAAVGANDMRDVTANQNHASFGAQATPQFVVGPTMDGLRWRVTVTPQAICADTIGLSVLNDGTITRVSNGAVLTAPFSSGDAYTFTGTPALTLPGTGEDFELSPVIVNGLSSSYVTDSNLIGFHFESPLGGFNFSVPLVVAQFYPTGGWPGSSYPGIQMDIFSALPPVVVFDGNASGGAFGPTLIVPGGMTIAGYFPVGLQGFSCIVQALCLNGVAANGIFASSTARELVVY